MLTSHTLNTLRKMSDPVRGAAGGEVRLPARVVAQCLSGVVRLIVNHVGHDEMRRACADLALDEGAWAAALRFASRSPDADALDRVPGEFA